VGESANNDQIVGSCVVSVFGSEDCLVISLNCHMLVKNRLLDVYWLCIKYQSKVSGYREGTDEF